MSNRRKLRQEPLHSCTYAAVADRDDETLVAEARRLSHDQLIAMTGLRRTSGVCWRQLDVHGDADLHRADHFLRAGTLAAGDQSMIAGYIEFLRDAAPSGALIVAECTVSQGSAALS